MTSNPTKPAKSLRKNATKAEALLWNKDRAKQLEGTKFRRQQPIGTYIVDFVSFEKHIIIELDGGQPADQKTTDQVRDKRLAEDGFTVLRFWNNHALENIDAVFEIIRQNCLK
jgi:very-short-patch-repair endonuclease